MSFVFIDESTLIKNLNRSWKISIISFFILVLELALIRQIPAEVRSISYFTNLILIASFFGLGLGCILSNLRPMPFLLPLGLVSIAMFIYVARGIVIYEEAQNVHYWLQYEELTKGQAYSIPLYLAALTTFIITALPFVTLGQFLAKAMDQRPRLIAYSWDIAGSLLGTVTFFVFSYFRTPPWVWIPLGALLWAVFIIPKGQKKILYVVAALPFLIFAYSPQEFKWSPYYYIQYSRETSGIRVWVNSSFHQQGIDFVNDKLDKNKVDAIVNKFSFPYVLYKKYHNNEDPQKVLILGAGTGNDVNIALINGAKEVTAVEIDPVILELGEEHNTMSPYQKPNVTVVVDDARHFLWNSQEKYDLVIFGTLDSQTLLSGQANLRLENYVYTAESFSSVKKLLAPQGMMAAYYSVFKPWLYERIYPTVRSAFQDQTNIYQFKDQFLFNTIIVGGKGIPNFTEAATVPDKYKNGLPSTDDWPFLYVQRPSVPSIYLKLSVPIFLFVLLAFIILRRTQPSSYGFHFPFLFLGLGFTLVESAAIVRLALLFGSTWVINAIIFSSALLTIFLANLCVLKGKSPPLNFAWMALIVSLAVNYFLPIQRLLTFSFGPRMLVSVVLVGVPFFFAAICFSHLFKDQKETGYALGINLIGTMIGGTMEYLSMLTGMRAIWLLAIIIYLCAFGAAYVRKNVQASPVVGIPRI